MYNLSRAVLNVSREYSSWHGDSVDEQHHSRMERWCGCSDSRRARHNAAAHGVRRALVSNHAPPYGWSSRVFCAQMNSANNIIAFDCASRGSTPAVAAHALFALCVVSASSSLAAHQFRRLFQCVYRAAPSSRRFCVPPGMMDDPSAQTHCIACAIAALLVGVKRRVGWICAAYHARRDDGRWRSSDDVLGVLRLAV